MAELLKLKEIERQYVSICASLEKRSNEELLEKKKAIQDLFWKKRQELVKKNFGEYFKTLKKNPSLYENISLFSLLNFASQWVDLDKAVELFYKDEFFYNKLKESLDDEKIFNKFESFVVKATRALFHKNENHSKCFYFDFFDETLPTLDPKHYKVIREKVGHEMLKLEAQGLLLETNAVNIAYTEYADYALFMWKKREADKLQLKLNF